MRSIGSVFWLGAAILFAAGSAKGVKAQTGLCAVTPTAPQPLSDFTNEIHWWADADEVGRDFFQMSRFVLNAADGPRKVTWPVGRIQALALARGQFAVHCSGVVLGRNIVSGPLQHRRGGQSIPTRVYKGENESVDYDNQPGRGRIVTQFRISPPEYTFARATLDMQHEVHLDVVTTITFSEGRYQINYEISSYGSTPTGILVDGLPPSVQRMFDWPLFVVPGEPLNISVDSEEYPTPVWMPIRVVDEEGRLRAQFTAQSVLAGGGWR